jgi:hypothetical protein
MKIEINNLSDLINFVENNKIATLQAKIEIIEKCLNVFFVEPTKATEKQTIERLKYWQKTYFKTKTEKPIFFD